MADLSQIFAPSPQVGMRPAPYSATGHALQNGPGVALDMTRRMVMNEVMERDLAPDDGDEFYEYVGKRLFQLGDIQGAMAVAQQRQEEAGMRAEAEQQRFENQFKTTKEVRDERTADREDERVDLEGRRVGLDEEAKVVREELDGQGNVIGYNRAGEVVDIKQAKKGSKISISNVFPGATELTPASKTWLQRKVMMGRDRLARLGKLRDDITGNERFLKILPRAGIGVKKWWAKLKLSDVSPTTKLELQKFAKARRGAFNDINNYLHEMSGAAITAQEATRLRKALANFGEGIFDGDDPHTFMQNLNSTIEELEQATNRYFYLLHRGGIDLANRTEKEGEAPPLSNADMPAIMDAAAEELQRAGLSIEEVRAKMDEIFYGKGMPVAPEGGFTGVLPTSETELRVRQEGNF